MNRRTGSALLDPMCEQPQKLRSCASSSRPGCQSDLELHRALRLVPHRHCVECHWVAVADVPALGVDKGATAAADIVSEVLLARGHGFASRSIPRSSSMKPVHAAVAALCRRSAFRTGRAVGPGPYLADFFFADGLTAFFAGALAAAFFGAAFFGAAFFAAGALAAFFSAAASLSTAFCKAFALRSALVCSALPTSCRCCAAWPQVLLGRSNGFLRRGAGLLQLRLRLLDLCLGHLHQLADLGLGVIALLLNLPAGTRHACGHRVTQGFDLVGQGGTHFLGGGAQMLAGLGRVRTSSWSCAWPCLSFVKLTVARGEPRGTSNLRCAAPVACDTGQTNALGARNVAALRRHWGIPLSKHRHGPRVFAIQRCRCRAMRWCSASAKVCERLQFGPCNFGRCTGLVCMQQDRREGRVGVKLLPATQRLQRRNASPDRQESRI